jgi:hypothetical protein
MSFTPSSKPQGTTVREPNEPIAHAAPGQWVDALLSAPGGAAELYLYDRTCAQLAQGTGHLQIALRPDTYHLRQRIGNREAVEVFTIAPGATRFDYPLKPLAFPSPIPMAGTSLSPDNQEKYLFTGAVQPDEARLRILLRHPGQAVRVQEDDVALARLQAHLARLSIELLDGSPLVDFEQFGTLHAEDGIFVLDLVRQEPMLVLAQRCRDGRKRCLPLYLYKGWATQVFLLSLTEEDSGEALDINLDNASLIIQRGGSGAASASLRFEAARKALAYGRSISGWTQAPEPDGRVPEEPDPLFALIDAQLRLRAKPTGDIAITSALIDHAATVLGDTSADIVAVRAALAERDGVAPMPAPDEPLAGPPMLQQSWRQLLAAYGATRLLDGILPEPYGIEQTSTWFIWSTSSDLRGPPPASDPVGAAVAQGTDWRSTLMTLLERGRAAYWPGASGSQLAPHPRTEPAEGESEAQAVLRPQTLEHAVANLATLHRRGDLQDWLACIQFLGRTFLHEQSRLRTDPAVRHLLASLALAADGTLVEALGVEQFMRRALTSLHLPDRRLLALVAWLAHFVVTQGHRAQLERIIDLMVPGPLPADPLQTGRPKP